MSPRDEDEIAFGKLVKYCHNLGLREALLTKDLLKGSQWFSQVFDSLVLQILKPQCSGNSSYHHNV